MKLTPLYTIAQNLNAQFTEQAGWRVPLNFSDFEAEIAAARDKVALADCSANGKLTIEGQQAATFLQTIWEVSSLEIGKGVVMANGEVYRLRADMFFISTPPGGEAQALQTLAGAAQSFADLITVTDITHGRAELRLVGPASAELLSRLCGLDFHPGMFSNLAAKQGSVAKTAQLIIRRDLGQIPAFSLIGSSSLGAYLWETIMQAGRDLAIAPIGQAALKALDEGREKRGA
jgi:heterotetrameric sarcosine oxidase gamma subunit